MPLHLIIIFPTLQTLLNAVETYPLKYKCYSAVTNEWRRRLKLDDRCTTNTFRFDDSRPQTICVSTYKDNILSIHQYNPITDRWFLFALENAENKLERSQIATVAASGQLLFLGGKNRMDTDVRSLLFIFKSQSQRLTVHSVLEGKRV